MADLRRSLVITFFASSGSTIIHFVVSLILARLLLPSEIGVFSMTVVFVNIAHVFRDFGVGSYLLREPDLTNEKIRAAIGVLFTSSGVIALILFCASGWIADWFDEPGIVPVMRLLSIGFVFIPFGSVTHSLLNREYAAGKQARVAIISTVSYAATCLLLAWSGFGTMSLAWANLVNIIVGAVAYAPYRPKNMPWLPSFRKWGKIVHFGLGSLVSNCAAQINNSMPDIILGKLSGARDVGLLSRANSTVAIFSYVAGSTINYGALTYVSQAHDRGESLTPLLNRTTALLTGTGWPVLGVTAVLGHEIVLALYGSKWLESASAVPLLALAGMINMAFNYTPTALTALGRPYLSAIPVIVTMLVRIIAALLIYDGSLHSFAWVLLIASIAMVPIMLYQQRRYLAYRTSSMMQAIYPSLVVTIVCTLTAFLLRLIMPQQFPALVNLLWAAIPLTAVWYLALRLCRHPLTEEIHHFANGMKMRFKAA
jgi:O-antigen/teichoic acid export membrane protein